VLVAAAGTSGALQQQLLLRFQKQKKHYGHQAAKQRHTR
jgi:hypothetical protein